MYVVKTEITKMKIEIEKIYICMSTLRNERYIKILFIKNENIFIDYEGCLSYIFINEIQIK